MQINRTVNRSVSFRPLHLPMVRRQGVETQGFRVYRAPGDFTDVVAETASQAIAESGVERPWKVERLGTRRESILPPGSVAREEVAEETPDIA